MKFRTFLLTLCLALGVTLAADAQVKPASMFGSGMVLQREAPIKVWGVAAKGEKIEVTFADRKLTTKAGRDGKWSVTLSAMPAGGPYSLSVSGKNSAVTYDDVMMGEVWLCSGQSNMEWSVNRSTNAPKEIAAADYPMIRCFTVIKGTSAEPKDELVGEWVVCSPATVGNFTAVGYFFARDLWRELKIPVGIINSSWGGTDIEPWTSQESFETLPATVRRPYDPAVKELMTTPEGKLRREKYDHDFANDPALAAGWYGTAVDPAGWETMNVPQKWSGTPLESADGHIWFRHEFDLPASADGVAGVVSLGPIDDIDITWINGVRVGQTSGHNLSRLYNIGGGVLRAGRNVIAVRVTDIVSEGGFCGEPEELWVEAAGERYSLGGDWSYQGSVINSDYGMVSDNPNAYHSLLYNAMINPIVDYRIKGAIWYQGENNAWNANSYRTLFPNMITDWRNKWGYEFPFYWVQLADFMAESMSPEESSWAELREAQSMTLSLPKTGQAVIIDIGDAYDIHPANKQDVGRRLALNALVKDYGRTDMIYSGPVYASMRVDGNTIIVSFDTYGSELVVRSKYGYLQGFAIAGEDRVFHWAQGRIENGRVVVQSDAVAKPVAVRYGWSNNPKANLFNSEGLPAGPFRTDDWPGITK